MAKYDVTYGARTVRVDEDDIIMDALENAGVDIPYSCRSGNCTACLCIVASGTVADDASVTTDMMKAKGLCSPCVSSPKSNVALTFIGDDLSEVISTPEPMEINSNIEAVYHYFFGGGSPVELGAATVNALVYSPESDQALSELRDGTRSKNGSYSVNLTSEMFHVGNTGVTYQTLCSGGVCTTFFQGFNYSSGPDGFRSPIDVFNILNRNVEIPGATPYNYIPHFWEETYPDPALLE